MCNVDVITLLGLRFSYSFCSGYLAGSVLHQQGLLNISLNLWEETNLSVACKCSSVSRDLNTGLLTFIDEKNT